MITYLLPVMIGSTGGHLVGEAWRRDGGWHRGVIIGADIPMFLGSMIMGPLGGLGSLNILIDCCRAGFTPVLRW